MEIAVEILVDHSGSMAGQKFERARQILGDIAPELLESSALMGAKTFSGGNSSINDQLT